MGFGGDERKERMGKLGWPDKVEMIRVWASLRFKVRLNLIVGYFDQRLRF